jgi:nicotinamidase-related amidase
MRSSLGTLVVVSLALWPAVLPAPAGKEEAPVPNRPKVPGKLRLHLRERREQPPGNGTVRAVERTADWDAARTAILICDMWDDHYCKSAAQRVKVMVPRMNEVITAARSHGVLIIHAPSGTMSVYEGTPHRKRLQQARPAKPPVPIAGWCHLDPKREPPLPVDTSKCSCDDPVVGPAVRKYNRQHAGLDITGFDGVSDSGPEIYNVLVQEGIDNVVLI